MIKVGFIFKAFPVADHLPMIGGSAKAPYRVFKYLAASGKIEVTQIIAFEGAVPPGHSYPIRVIKPRFKLYLKTLYQNLMSLPAVLAMFRRGDVVQCHHPHYGLFCALLKLFWYREVKFIVKAHGTALPELRSNQYGGVRGLILKANGYLHFYHDRLVLSAADICLCSSDFQREEMRKLYRVGAEKIFSIYNGYDPQYFYTPASKHDYSKSIGVVFCGRLVPKKGVYECIVLCEYLRRMGFDLSLQMVLGSRQYIENPATLEQVVTACKMHDWINMHFDLTENELADLYRRSTVGLVTSKNYESIPSVIYEMRACGVAVFATYRWGIPEVLSREYALTGDPDADAKIIAAYLSSRDLIPACGDNAADFSYSVLVKKYLEHY